jgi:hypothetical protein
MHRVKSPAQIRGALATGQRAIVDAAMAELEDRTCGSGRDFEPYLRVKGISGPEIKSLRASTNCNLSVQESPIVDRTLFWRRGVSDANGSR